MYNDHSVQFIPSLMKICQLVQMLLGGDGHTDRYINNIDLSLLLKNESRLEIVITINVSLVLSLSHTYFIHGVE